MINDLIMKRLEIIGELQDELSKLRVHYEETLENDPQYQKVQEEQEVIKKQNTETKEKKEKVLSTPSYKVIADQIKEKRTELKEHKEALGQELADYYRESGTLEIEDPEGNVKRIKFSVRLVS